MHPFVSVIIPTYNRRDSLRQTLASLVQQTFPAHRFEVIVVDDGSAEDVTHIKRASFPFALFYMVQQHQGATVARNKGAREAHGDVLVFADDDIEFTPEALEALVTTNLHYSQSVVVGTLLVDCPHPVLRAYFSEEKTSGNSRSQEVEPISFVECFTGLLCVNREDFFNLGMFQDSTGGWPNWDDVDFGYRAHLAGYQILRNHRAKAIHHDRAAASLKAAAQRSYRAGEAAVRLFQVYPEIQPHLPMFHDKTPIVWGQDPPRLIARKLARHVASSRPTLRSMEQLVHVLERRYPSPTLLRPLYRWVIGGYIFRGYREGLRELGRG